MIKSMTGYGKGVAELENGKLTVEIRSVNGKSSEINLKSSLLPKDKEIGVRKYIADTLQRGSIDVFLNWEPNAADGTKKINADLARQYWEELQSLAPKMGQPSIDTILRLPDVLDARKSDVITEENWPRVQKAIEDAVNAIDNYRKIEGEALYKDVSSRVKTILDIYCEVESYEAERIDAVKQRITKAAEEAGVKLDKERFEQEIIFYLEKLDINEEKVRLRQHCKYFMETIDSELYPGKKLGFIIQEMGREINTTGSKANHAPIQKCVVRMKDELEKIREQSMNIL